MLKNNRIYMILAFIFWSAFYCARQHKSFDYLGLSPPGKTLQIFALGRISTAAREHSCVTISPDGKEIFFTRQEENLLDILCMRLENGVWTDPEPAPFTSDQLDDGAVFSPDGERLYFGSKRPINPGDVPKSDKDIWYVERSKNDWSKPIHVAPPLNTEKNEGSLCFTKKGFAYFHSDRHSVLKDADIYRIRYIDGEFSQPERLDPPINTPIYEAAPFVAPDESYIIYYQIDLSDLSSMRLNLSFKQEDNSWSEPINLSEALNLGASDLMKAKLSPDGKYLFILDQGDITWVDATVIEQLRPQ